jgi:hypothetical protein
MRLLPRFVVDLLPDRPASEAICREVQTAHRLTIDGIVGPITWLTTFQAT